MYICIHQAELLAHREDRVAEVGHDLRRENIMIIIVIISINIGIIIIISSSIIKCISIIINNMFIIICYSW